MRMNRKKEMKKMTMTKLGTMIYEDGTDSYSVFTFNFEIQNQLDNISCHSPELCCKLPTDDSSGKMYRIKNLKLLFRSVYKELHADHETGAADNK